jgi:hypothetical protein
MASSASLIVTPRRFRAVTSRPSGKCKSILRTNGRQSGFFSTSLSSKVAGDVLSFLRAQHVSLPRYHHQRQCIPSVHGLAGGRRITSGTGQEVSGSPVQLLRLGCDLDLLLFFLCLFVSPTWPHSVPRLRHCSGSGATHLGRSC